MLARLCEGCSRAAPGGAAGARQRPALLCKAEHAAAAALLEDVWRAAAAAGGEWLPSAGAQVRKVLGCH